MVFANEIEEIPENRFHEKISELNSFTVIDFFAGWDMPCLMFSPLVDEIAKKFNPHINFTRVNIDRNSKLMEKMNIPSLPALLFFYEGKEVERICGEIQEEELEKKLQSFINK